MTALSNQLSVTWVLSCADGQDHAITDEENTRVYKDRSGLPEALCGHRVVAGSLTLPPGPRCPHCEAILRARATVFDPDLRMARRPRHRHRAPSFLRRLFPRPVRSASHRPGSRADRTAPDHGDPAAEPPTGGEVAVPPPVTAASGADSTPVTRTE